MEIFRMKFALLMDIDNTLTPHRNRLKKEMADNLGRLNVPFYLAAGSDLDLIESQFFKPLWNFGFRKNFEAFLGNGATHYRCAFLNSYKIELLYKFSLRKHIGENYYHYLKSVINEALTREEFKITPPIRVIGEQFIDRGSMINFVPIGRPKEDITGNDNIISKEAYANREKFEEFDKKNKYRSRVITFLEKKLTNIIKEKDLIVMLGGRTSFDICINRKDKTNAVRQLLKYGYEKVVFLGDALEGDGNDSVIRKYIENWKDTKPCPLSAHQVSGWKDTLEKFKSNGWIYTFINFFTDQEQTLEITEDVVKEYSLEEWSKHFSLMTAGYRDRLDPENLLNPDASFNGITLSICLEAKARVFEKKSNKNDTCHVHIGGEVRPHTQSFIKIAAMIFAAHKFTVHLRNSPNTAPVWYSSFGIAYEECLTGDNFTASHSPFYKGGWKPTDSQGKQLIADEEEIIQEIQSIIKNHETINFSPWKSNKLIKHDFNIDKPYLNYQRYVFDEQLISDIIIAGEKGFKCSICPVGGSMKKTTERLFKELGLSTGEDGVIQYFYGEESSDYHGIGQIDNKNFGVDPGKKEIYTNIGVQDKLLNGDANFVVLWDPDGDRIKVASTIHLSEKSTAEHYGIEVDEKIRDEKCVIYFTPNQLFLMISAFRIDLLRKTGILSKYDWFIGASFPTTKSLEELANHENIPFVQTNVGFKYMGDLCQDIENRLGKQAIDYKTATGDNVKLGDNPRALILCEESGGAILGATELFKSKTGVNKMLALREKDGMQIGLMMIALAAHLFNRKISFITYYRDLVKQKNIEWLHYIRHDEPLYDESKIGEELKKLKEEGIEKRDTIMLFFKELIQKHQQGELSLKDIRNTINSKRSDTKYEIPEITKVSWLIENALFETASMRFLVRPSGTDSVLRYYLDGKDRTEIEQVLEVLKSLTID